ncbi:hypothetical protein K1X12_15920 [Hyphomonas sp. WL0036]|uniref:hypothetical protein n=1 Tax=Hyphomonas sediminis TaxID=2866160 RepID=UPI001C7EB6C0|nr:hypothetical protein [Hyphomonas sediminis]MBY9068389.1 hypothetical protein [Hyphomonas sediminis]
MTAALILIASLLAAGGLLLPRVRNSPSWRATVTPLASIIGSGFLVLGPILSENYGKFAPLVMVALCAAAYAFGSAIRFNISALDETPARPATEKRLETAASWALAFAYCVSVAYYLNLFGAFLVKMTPLNSAANAKLATSAALIFILVMGWMKGFAAMERMEQITVSVKLAIIVGLLAGLSLFFGKQAAQDALIFDAPTQSGWPAVAMAFGLIVTVQGFETSRYLGEEYSAAMRRRTMQYAQWISTGIYLLYVLLLTFTLDVSGHALSETAIVELTVDISIILPVMLVVAALAAQFSAAVADTSGAGGLAEELTRGRLPARAAYVMLILIGLGLTWFVDIFEIITFASRAFALYYCLQCAIAARTALAYPRDRMRGVFYLALSALALAIVFLGKSVEGGG